MLTGSTRRHARARIICCTHQAPASSMKPMAVNGDQIGISATTSGSSRANSGRSACRNEQCRGDPARQRVVGHPEQLGGVGRVLEAVGPPLDVVRRPQVLRQLQPAAQDRADDVHAAEQHQHGHQQQHGRPAAHASDRQPQEQGDAQGGPHEQRRVGELQPEHLAHHGGRQEKADGRAQHQFGALAQPVTDRPCADHQVAQHQVTRLPVEVGKEQVPGAAQRRPAHGHRKHQDRHAPADHPRSARPGRTRQQVACARQQQRGQGDPDPPLQPAQQKQTPRAGPGTRTRPVQPVVAGPGFGPRWMPAGRGGRRVVCCCLGHSPTLEPLARYRKP